MSSGFCLFETPVGPCALAFGEAGLIGVQLPDASAAGSRARMRRLNPGIEEMPPSPEAQAAIAAMQALLSGEKRDLREIRLDMTGVPPFNQAVYDVARTIAPGATLTYGEVATRLGQPGAAQAVGQALGQNPFTIVVPCHRVLAANGRYGGFSAHGGTKTKLRLLRIEGAPAAAQLPLFGD
jgi:methylated-DNA-[protein]-cysteine S-methyltransferase